MESSHTSIFIFDPFLLSVKFPALTQHVPLRFGWAHQSHHYAYRVLNLQIGGHSEYFLDICEIGGFLFLHDIFYVSYTTLIFFICCIYFFVFFFSELFLFDCSVSSSSLILLDVWEASGMGSSTTI